MSNKMYNKYLKYKQKYLNLLNLKAQLTGGGAYYDNSYLTINIINNITNKRKYILCVLF